MEMWVAIIGAGCWSAVWRGYFDHRSIIVGLKGSVLRPNRLRCLICFVVVDLTHARNFKLSWNLGYSGIVHPLRRRFHVCLLILNSNLRVAGGMLRWMILREIGIESMLHYWHFKRHFSDELLLIKRAFLLYFFECRDIIRASLLHIKIIEGKNWTINIFIGGSIDSLNLSSP